MCVHLFRRGGRRASVAINGNGTNAKLERELFVSLTRDDLFASRSASPRFAEIGIGWIRRAEMVIASLRRALLSSSNPAISIDRACVCARVYVCVYLVSERRELFENSPFEHACSSRNRGHTGSAMIFVVCCAF